MCRASSQESSELKVNLANYEASSGQIINFSKSSIIFGSKVTEEKKIRVKDILGIETEGGEGMYLGLSESFSGSKIKLLNFIKEKLKGRFRGWFAKSLSQGGKEILLKSIALAFPVYAMSCFRLSKDLCSKLTSAMTEYWWSSGNNRHKIAWVTWQKLCKKKELGGLGFHDIELQKQAWRIWNQPELLLSRILRDRYFRNSSFLECSIGTRPSYAWRSIMHGRDLMKQGLITSIGDGKSTNVWSTNWVMDSLPRPPLYHPSNPINLSLKVSDLLVEHTGFGNSTMLKRTFAEDDVHRILAIQARPSHPDSLRWVFTPFGSYTSKSGYKLLEDLIYLNRSNNVFLPPLEKRLWSNLWKTKTSPKL